MTKAPKTPKAPTVMIQNCNFTNESEGFKTLARAIEANARAVEALANKLQQPTDSMIKIGP